MARFRLELDPWHPLRVEHAVAVAVWFVAIVALYFAGLPGWTGLFDDANLAFHEFGHPAFAMFGDRASLYGGTLFQLLLPAVVVGSFYWRREAAGVAVGAIWLFQNFLSIGRYMADARAQELPLAGGGEHDWWHIFGRWDALEHDVDIGRFTSALGWLGMFAVLVWFGRQYLFRQERAS